MSQDQYPAETDASSPYPEEVYTERVDAGKRTYYFDVRNTRSGDDYFVTITESKRTNRGKEKHKVYLYKEDFGAFVSALHNVVHHIMGERLPEHDFEDVPKLTGVDRGGE